MNLPSTLMLSIELSCRDKAANLGSDEHTLYQSSTHLHAIRIQLPHRPDPARSLDLNQAPLQRLQLVINRQQRLRHRLGRVHEVVNVPVAAADEVQQRALDVQLGGLAVGIQEIAVDARLVNLVELALEVVQVRLAQRPGLRDGDLFEVVADRRERVVLVEEVGGNFAFSR